MKTYINTVNAGLKAFAATMFFLLSEFAANAQDGKIEVDGEQIGNWFQQHWLWVAAGVVALLMLIGLLSSGSRSRRRTTIVREESADGVVRTTTTEIKE